jgi:acyl dehydratase
VHAFVDVRYARLFREGDAITCRARTVVLRQIRPGALRVQRAGLRDTTGALVAEMDDANKRGVEMDGPDSWLVEPAAWPDPPVGSDAGMVAIEIPVPRTAAHVYTECCDLYSPIHTERRAALAAGPSDTILHGSATLLYALREIVDYRLDGDPRGVRRLAARSRGRSFPAGRSCCASSASEAAPVCGSSFSRWAPTTGADH